MPKYVRMIALTFAVVAFGVFSAGTEAKGFELLDRMVSVSQKGAVQKGGKCHGSCGATQKGGHGALQKGGHGALQKGGHGALQKGGLLTSHGAHQKGAAQKGKGHGGGLFSRSHGKGKGGKGGGGGGKVDLGPIYKSSVENGTVMAPLPPLPSV